MAVDSNMARTLTRNDAAMILSHVGRITTLGTLCSAVCTPGRDIVVERVERVYTGSERGCGTASR